MPRLRRLALLLLALAGAEACLVAIALPRREAQRQGRAAGAAIAARLGLTDLAVWTEARYTRHPSLADLATPFQDHPGALEHFPAGSVLAPPPHLRPAGPRAQGQP